jgi:phosphoethanolamine N-methyltransferase
MAHENEYHDSYVAMLQLIWGKGYMAPGGPGNVAKMLNGISTHGKRVLDIGCGIGGPAFEMARTHGAEVVGIDLEAPLIERAAAAAEELGLSERCTFRTVEAGPLDFPDEAFDIVFASGAFTQIDDKASILAESFRILRPGGWLTCYDWLRGDGGGEYSDAMKHWFEMEGLTYAMATLEQYRQLLIDAGFTDVAVDDASDWYRAEARREYGLMKGDLYPRMVELIGREEADHFVEDWRAMVVVIDSGEMRQAYVRGRRP